jgi:non-specific serine/threonine protein kinase/serine/threonine-protein kinase
MKTSRIDSPPATDRDADRRSSEDSPTAITEVGDPTGDRAAGGGAVGSGGVSRDGHLPSDSGISTEAGSQIGPYRLLERLGEGGMGEVWLAEQQAPVHRTVARKLIKRGVDTRQVVGRFEAERQALAMIYHPSIAKIYDAGATPDGRPYFVMEHVKGVPVTDHADIHRLTTAQRLELFRQICDGVQHAHRKAILHRDLKPSNILVSLEDGKAEAKIIDFGVAKAMAQPLTEKTMHTQIGEPIGTLDYMSPEQAEMTGQDVDTRTDVYSLGMILYKLLTGHLPFERLVLREVGLDAIRRIIREEDPARPSTRVSGLGDERATDAPTDVPPSRTGSSGICVATSTGSSSSVWRRTARAATARRTSFPRTSVGIWQGSRSSPAHLRWPTRRGSSFGATGSGSWRLRS